MNMVHDDCFVVYVREKKANPNRPMMERMLVSCGSYQEAEMVRRENNLPIGIASYAIPAPRAAATERRTQPAALKSNGRQDVCPTTWHVTFVCMHGKEGDMSARNHAAAQGRQGTPA